MSPSMMCTMPCAQQARGVSSSFCTISCAPCQSPRSSCVTACVSFFWLMPMASLIDPGPGHLHEVPHLLGFGGDEAREVVDAVGDDGQPQGLQALGHGRIAQRGGDLGVELL